jgi:hypothetical protein
MRNKNFSSNGGNFNLEYLRISPPFRRPQPRQSPRGYQWRRSGAQAVEMGVWDGGGVAFRALAPWRRRRRRRWGGRGLAQGAAVGLRENWKGVPNLGWAKPSTSSVHMGLTMVFFLNFNQWARPAFCSPTKKGVSFSSSSVMRGACLFMSFPRHNRNKRWKFCFRRAFWSNEFLKTTKKEEAQDMSSLRKMESDALTFVVCRGFNKNILCELHDHWSIWKL